MANIYVHAVHTAFELQSDSNMTHTYTHPMYRICSSDNTFSMATSCQATFSVLLVLARAMFCLIFISQPHMPYLWSVSHHQHIFNKQLDLSFIIRCTHGNRHHYTHFLFTSNGPFLFIKALFNGLVYAIHIFDIIATLHQLLYDTLLSFTRAIHLLSSKIPK